MSLPSSLLLTWPQVCALLLLAIAGAFLAERIVGNTPRFGLLGSMALGVIGGWLFGNLPFDFSLEPRLEDMPVIRTMLGALLLVAAFAYFRKQAVRR